MSFNVGSGGGGSPEMVAGMIILWSGSTGSIPAGWVICDGNNGTPDLRNNFVVGAGDLYAVGDIGGDTSHDHSGQTSGPSDVVTVASGDAGNGTSDVGTFDHTHLISGSSNLPPYYALAYIMKT